MSILRRWREHARQYGTGGLIKYLGARLLRPVWEQAVVDLYVLTELRPIVQPRLAVRIAELDAAHGARLPLAADDWANRWRHGHKCYAAWDGDECVHYSWVSTDISYLAEVHQRLALGPGQAYIYDCFTDGTRRGAGIFPAVLSRIQADLLSAGTNCIWIAVEEENRSSSRAIERAGFARGGTLRYKRLMGMAQAETAMLPDAPPLALTFR